MLVILSRPIRFGTLKTRALLVTILILIITLPGCAPGTVPAKVVRPMHRGRVPVAGGGYSGYAVEPDGTVWTWGDMAVELAGSSAPYTRDVGVPVRVPGVAAARAVAGGWDFGLALKKDGTVWAWGANYYGQLGNNSAAMSSMVAVQVYGLRDVTAIAAGVSTGYALKADGTVWAWGYNNVGQLGDDTVANSPVPVRVTGLTHVTAIAAGSANGYALKADGTVWAWGFDDYGQLGRNLAFDSKVPVRVPGLHGVVAIAAGDSTGYALKADGTVYAWGRNDYGQLGNGSTSSSFPVRVSRLTDVTAIAAGSASAYALEKDGTVRAWGEGVQGALGDGAARNSRLPVAVSGLKDVTAIAAGVRSGYAVEANGTVWAWGVWDDTRNPLTDGLEKTDSRVPVRIAGLRAQ